MTSKKKWNPNQNHPKKGESIKVDPIRDPKDIKKIKKMLTGNSRNLCLFTFGINTNLRASDLLKITVGQVRDLQPGHEIEINETKTKKPRRITLNKSVVTAINALIAARDYRDTDALFAGQRGPLTVPSVHRLVKGWCRAIKLRGNYGSHTMRKTFGYHQRVIFGVGLPELMVTFNHSTQRQTLEYLCIQPNELKNIYNNEI